jgi:hypothetical protein
MDTRVSALFCRQINGKLDLIPCHSADAEPVEYCVVISSLLQSFFLLSMPFSSAISFIFEFESHTHFLKIRNLSQRYL